MMGRNFRKLPRSPRRVLVLSILISVHGFLLGFIPAFQLLSPSRFPLISHTHLFSAQNVDTGIYNCNVTSWNGDQTSVPTSTTNPEGSVVNTKGYFASTTIKEKIQLLKDSVDIVAVIESYSLPQFRRTGPDRATAICPFHEDRNPSLSMDASKQIYKCFSCGVGGDVIHFVQEYSKLPIWQPRTELSFMQAACYVSSKFGNGDLLWTGNWSSSTSGNTRKKERILLANAYAASFYSNCFQQPNAGGARYHVRTRGLSVPTIRTFAIGYAPDSYWDGRAASRKGQGSLVEHLLSVGISVREMLYAGLAVVGNGATSHELANRTQGKVLSGDEELDSSLLVDRFRNRIMVPIWDESGYQILGFGGRVVPPPESDDDALEHQQQRRFKNPKYLNSPESDVFVKRKLLFGQHLAKSALQKFSGRKAPTPPLLIVEGYMDAMTLWNAGIHNVVASMGTAISLEQLESAARTVGTRGGRIILCLDNDDAGRMAIYRLCGNGIITECITKHAVAVSVGQLPYSIKDPADFFEYQRKQGSDSHQAVKNFQEEVIGTSVDWTEWFIQKLLDEYDCNAPSGVPGSFSVVFERIADFLASSLTPAERTKRAYEVAGQLSKILAIEQNATEISVSVRIQLESDLVNLASRLTSSKQAIQHRVVASNDASISDPIAVASLVRGYGPNSDDHSNKLSKNATRTIASLERTKIYTRRGSKSIPHRDNNSAGKSSNSRRPTTTTRAKLKRDPDGVSLTAHFNGFRFAHQSDMDWLGLRDSKKKGRNDLLVLGRCQPSSLDGIDGDTKFRNNKFIYFNSVGFNGKQFLTDSASDAGYTRQSKKPDASVIETGLASLVEQDVATMIVAAENTLLRILVNDGSARSIVKNMLSARLAVNYGGDIHWSCPEKQWLFDVLINGFNVTAEEHIDPYQLRTVLAQLPDAPPGAFSNESSDVVAHQTTLLPKDFPLPRYDDPSENSLDVESMVHASSIGITDMPLAASEVFNASLAVAPSTRSLSGSLDAFFVTEVAPMDSSNDGDDVILGTRNSLAVQENLVTLLSASMAMKSKLLREKLAMSTTTQEKSSNIQSVLLAEASDISSLHSGVTTSLNTTISDVPSDESPDALLPLDASQLELLQQLHETTHCLQSLQASTHRIRTRLLDESACTGIEGSISRALQLELSSQLDDHVRAGWQNFPPPGINDVPYETELERMATEWGEWYEDDYIWTPGTSVAMEETFAPRMADDVSIDVSASDRESVDDFMERIHREWSDWVD